MVNEKRLIYANELLEVLELCEFDTECDRDTAYSQIKDAPTVDAVEVVHGRWDAVFEYEDFQHAYCSACGKRSEYMTNYCPNCGAKMDGDGNV